MSSAGMAVGAHGFRDGDVLGVIDLPNAERAVPATRSPIPPTTSQFRCGPARGKLTACPLEVGRILAVVATRLRELGCSLV